MAAPTTGQELVTLIQQSSLVEPDYLATSLKQIGPGSTKLLSANEMSTILVAQGLLTSFQAQQLLKGKWRSFLLGRFKVLAPIGLGMMGQVFLASEGTGNRRVALKVLSTEATNNPILIKRFHREARALASLDHPNIVRAFDLEEHAGKVFLVLEYVEGSNLREIVGSHGPLPITHAVDIVVQAALGLGHAHATGWVHRDVKPSNLLRTPQGLVKILDLGLARLLDDEEERITRNDKAILGTLDYLAPEQSLDSHNVDFRADIYGLGATFYYLLTGKAPFGRANAATKLAWHRQVRHRPLHLFRKDVPAELEAVLDRMLEKQPQHRYQSMAEVRTALAPWTSCDKGTLAPRQAPDSVPEMEAPSTEILVAMQMPTMEQDALSAEEQPMLVPPTLGPESERQTKKRQSLAGRSDSDYIDFFTSTQSAQPTRVNWLLWSLLATALTITATALFFAFR